MMPKYINLMIACFVCTFMGCGGGSDADNPNAVTDSGEVLFAKNIRATVNDLIYTFESAEGNKVAALKDNMLSFEESGGINLEGAPVGEHSATYESIKMGVEELQALLNGAPSADEVKSKLDELKELVAKLPE